MIFISFIVALVLIGTTFANAKISISKSKLSIMNSETKPGNLLPQFMFMMGSVEGGNVGVAIGGGRGTAKPFIPDDSCGDDIFDGAMEEERSAQLPYLTQDLWGCEREQTDINTILLEDESLKVTITPQYAGKVWGIYDKKRQRELLFANRAHQPANIAALKSWAAGGAEWNWSPGIIGHSAFSETQVFTARIETERGPMVRVYEYDRYNSTVWQVDMIVSNGTFIAHPRITNPTDVDLRGYWWTCVAVESRPETRIFAPADHVAETTRGQMRNAPWPFYAMAIENASFTGFRNQFMTDNSYLGNNQLGDLFLRIPDTTYTPYIAHTQTDGYVLVHGHPLNGTKFFTWGQDGPGRFMQDFLAGGGKRQGDYTELQVGPAPTQMQNFPVPKNSVRQWTEWFRGFDTDAKIMDDADYKVPINHIDDWLRSNDGMPTERFQDWDAFFAKHGTDTPAEILVPGQPWGALEEMRLGRPLVSGLKFSLPEKGTVQFLEAKPWVELLQQGTFSADTLTRLPLSYQTTDSWFELIKKSAETHGMTWLHALHIGIGLTERGFKQESINMFTQSNNLRKNPIATRCLGVLQTSYEAAWPYFQEAWKISQSDEYVADVEAYFRLTDNLVTEIGFFLYQNKWYAEMDAFLPMVPEANRGLDAYVTMEINVALYYKKTYQTAKDILSKNCFPTFAKARADLMVFWNDAVMGLAQERKGGALTNVEKHQARINNRIPDNIGCQYASEYCTNYW